MERKSGESRGGEIVAIEGFGIRLEERGNVKRYITCVGGKEFMEESSRKKGSGQGEISVSREEERRKGMKGKEGKCQNGKGRRKDGRKLHSGLTVIMEAG